MARMTIIWPNTSSTSGSLSTADSRIPAWIIAAYTAVFPFITAAMQAQADNQISRITRTRRSLWARSLI
jgi:hypothetical protein